jgi:hypothetical protein
VLLIIGWHTPSRKRLEDRVLRSNFRGTHTHTHTQVWLAPTPIAIPPTHPPTRLRESMDSVVVYIEGVTVIPCDDITEDDSLALEMGVRAAGVFHVDVDINKDERGESETLVDEAKTSNGLTADFDGSKPTPPPSPTQLLSPPSRSTSDGGKSATSCGSWRDETPTVKVVWKRTGSRRLPPTPSHATPHGDGRTLSAKDAAPGPAAVVAHDDHDGDSDKARVPNTRRMSRSVSDEGDSGWGPEGASHAYTPPISRSDSTHARAVAWKSSHRLRYTAPLPTVGSTQTPRSCVRVRVEIHLMANGSVVAIGTANVAVQPDPSRPDHDRLHDVAMHRVTKRRGSKARVLGARIAVVRLRAVSDPLLPFEKTVFFIRHGQSECVVPRTNDATVDHL